MLESEVQNAKTRNDREGVMIRRVLIAISALSVLGVLVSVVLIAAMISANFNILEWLE